MPAAVKDSATGRAANEDLVVTIAVDVLAAKGWFEEEPDDALIVALHRLYRANQVCQVEVRYTSEPLHDMLASRPGEHLADFYQNECQEAWERTVATWTCDCGQTYKVLPGGLPGRPDDRFYRLGVDGVLGALVGTTRGIGISHNKACPGCGRDFATTVKRLADPQLRLFVDA
jgi:hypothetical protein